MRDQMAQDLDLLERADVYCEALFTAEPPTAALLVNALRDALARRLTDAEQAQCVWTYDDDTTSWDTACGEKFQFSSDGPAENGMKWCPYCGDKLLPAAPTGETEATR